MLHHATPAATHADILANCPPRELYCERAKLADGQEVLELGCGWGSLCLYVAAKYPKSRVTAVSNSNSQREFIASTAAKCGIGNLTVVSANLVDFQPPKSRLTGGSTCDRIVTIECFEHLKNYQVGTVRPKFLRLFPLRCCEPLHTSLAIIVFHVVCT